MHIIACKKEDYPVEKNTNPIGATSIDKGVQIS